MSAAAAAFFLLSSLAMPIIRQLGAAQKFGLRNIDDFGTIFNGFESMV